MVFPRFSRPCCSIGGETSIIDYDVRRDLSEQLDDDAAQQDSGYPISYPVSSEPWSESRFLVCFVKTMDLGDATEDGSVIDSTNAFLGAFYPAAATTIIALTSFLLLRPYFPDVYDCKRERVRLGGSKKQREGADDMPPELPKTVWEWIMLLASFSDEDIIRFIGADSLVFLRFLRMCFKASIFMMLYGFIVLLPLNILGANNLPQFERFSASNIGDKSNFLYAHLVGAYLFTALVLYLLYKEYNVYVDLRQRYMKSPSVQSYSIVIRDIPTDVDRETVERYLTGLLGHESVAIHLVENAAPYDKLIDEKDSALFGLEGAKQKYEKTQVRPRHKTGLLGLWGEQVDSLDYYEENLKEVNNNIQKLQEGEHGFAHAAIVTFETIRVATAFQHIPLQSEVRFMKVSTCPARNDLLWNNLGVPLLNRGIRTLLVIGMVFFIIFCYTIPVSFVSSLANLQALARTKHLEWLQPVADFSPELTALLQGLVPPAILGLFFSLIPTFMVMLSRAECPKSESEAQTRAIWKVFLFSLFDNFLVVTFAGAVLEKLDMLKEVAGQPAEIINLLATTLPSQSNFFMNFIMVAGLSVMPLEILRLTPFIITKLKRKFLCSSQWDHLKAMTEDIGFHECYAFPLLVFLPMMSFSVLSPIMMIFVFAYYGLTYCIWLNQLLYVYNVPYHTGGSQFTVVFRCCIVSLAIFQLLLAGVFGLKRVTIPAALMIPLLVVTVFMGYTLTERFRQLGNTLTLENLLTTDVKEMSEDTVEALKKAYTLYQDDGSNDGFSHRTLQPLVEPYSITTDGLLADLVDDQTMQADVTLNDELQKEIDGGVAAAGGSKGVDDEEYKFESVENGV